MKMAQNTIFHQHHHTHTRSSLEKAGSGDKKKEDWGDPTLDSGS